MRIPTTEEFLKVANELKMTVLLDTEDHKHLHFMKPGDGNGWFDLVTWPGSLCVNGDYGTYAFSRIKHMFAFFRRDDLGVNPGYWAEKCTAVGWNDPIKEYEPEKFKAEVLRQFESWWEEGHITDKTREEYLDNIQYELFSDEGGHRGEIEAHDNASNYEFEGFDLPDFWEYDLREYTYRYIWNLYAIVWGIQQYDKYKEKP